MGMRMRSGQRGDRLGASTSRIKTLEQVLITDVTVELVLADVAEVVVTQ